MPLTYSFFDCATGRMRWAKSGTSAALRGHVLLCPGWGEWIEKYEEIIGEWNARGYEVTIFEWRGQGLSSRILEGQNKTWLPSFDVLVEDLDAFYRAHLAGPPLLIFAHSMGAHITLRWCLKHKNRNIKGLVLSSIMQEIVTAPIPLPLAKMIAKGMTALGFGQHYAIGQAAFDPTTTPFAKNTLTRDETRWNRFMGQLRERAELKFGGVTYGWLAAFFASSMQLEAELAATKLSYPVLLLGSMDDLLVTMAGIRRVASNLPGATLVAFEGAGHELLFEKDEVRNRAWKAIDAFTASL
jgi:lysophospholipase